MNPRDEAGERSPECVSVRELAPELALGVVSGPERAAALAHLDHCPACRAHVEELAGTTDALVLLAPQAEPAAGFESRVMDRMQGARRRTGRREVAAWILAAACALTLAGLVLFRDGGGRGRAELAVLRTASGETVGQALLYPARGEHAPWIYLSMPGWTEWVEARGASPEYSLRLDLATGERDVIDMPPVRPGREGWGTAVGADPEEITRIAVVDGDGRVLCSAAT